MTELRRAFDDISGLPAVTGCRIFPAHSAGQPHGPLCRSPDDPRALLVRRLIGVEGDWVAIPGESRVEKIPKVR